MVAKHLTDETLEEAVEAYYRYYGNKSEAARGLGLQRNTYHDRLAIAQERLGISLGKIVDGKMQPDDLRVFKLPPKGQVSYYLMGYAQNNTLAHPMLSDVEALVAWLKTLPETRDCRLLVGTGTYNKSAYGPKSVKRGTGGATDDEDNWYDPKLASYILDENVLLAPGCVWNGRSNILPTRKYPLSDKANLNGRLSNVIPHTKMHLESVPSMADEATKLNLSTGSLTQRNYLQKDAGYVAEQDHDYGFTMIAVDSDANWFPTQIEFTDEGLMFFGPQGFGAVTVRNSDVKAIRTEDLTPENSVTEAINWGDTHASEMDLGIRRLAFGAGGMLDETMPYYQFHNDLFSMRSRGHHELKDFVRSYEKYADGEDSVEDELQITADVLTESDRDWCETIVVPSNHDRHLDRWVNEADFRLDPLNAKFFARCLYQTLDAIDCGDKDFNLLEWALRDVGDFGMVRFLSEDEGFVLCKRKGFPGIECGLHGDLGPNGSRGTTMSLIRLGRPINKGHDHIATRKGKVMSAGALAIRLPYMHGPNSHTVANIMTFKNGARTHVIMWNGKWRA